MDTLADKSLHKTENIVRTAAAELSDMPNQSNTDREDLQ